MILFLDNSQTLTNSFLSCKIFCPQIILGTKNFIPRIGKRSRSFRLGLFDSLEFSRKTMLCFFRILYKSSNLSAETKRDEIGKVLFWPDHMLSYGAIPSSAGRYLLLVSTLRLGLLLLLQQKPHIIAFASSPEEAMYNCERKLVSHQITLMIMMIWIRLVVRKCCVLCTRY